MRSLLQIQFLFPLLLLYLPVIPIRTCGSRACEGCLDSSVRPMQQRADSQPEH
jgi:hypothetical protein